MSEAQASQIPVRTAAHSRAGIAAILVFQVIVMSFGALLVAANLWPAIFNENPGRAEAMAIKLSIYITLPMGILGTVLGIAGIMQETRRRKFAVVGLALCAVHTLICLFVMRG